MQNYDVNGTPCAPTDTGCAQPARSALYSLCFLLPLLYLSAGLPLPALLAGGTLPCVLLQLALTLPVCWLNRTFFSDCLHELRTGAPGAATLVAVGSGVALGYGVFATVRLVLGQPAPGGEGFTITATVLTFATIGKLPAVYAAAHADRALQELLRLVPQTACVLRDGAQVPLPVAELRPGELFVVQPGESIPVDGEVTDGVSSVEETALTGENAPVNKILGSTVYAATLNQGGTLTCRATHVGQDTVLSRVVRLRRDAATTTAPLGKKAARLSAALASATLGLAGVVVILWVLLGQTFAFALARGIAVLVICSPCALALAVPVAVAAGGSAGARQGILFKTAASLETFGATATVALDKTGTITTGAPAVVELVGTRKVPGKFLLGMAAGLGAQSEHPLARAIMQKAAEEKITVRPAAELTETPGRGLQGKFAGKIMVGGRADYVAEFCPLPAELTEGGEALAARGITPLYFGLDGHVAGMIGVSDVVKSTSKPAIDQLRALGLQVVLLTGDALASAQHIGELVGLDSAHVVADVLPAAQAAEIQRLQQQGAVAMVGSGATDAAALDRAENGVILGAGAAMAQPCADLVLLHGNLADIPTAVQLSRRVAAVMRQNLRWAFGYNAVCIPLAAGLLYPLGFAPGPVVAAIIGCFAGVFAAANARRLYHFAPQATPTAVPNDQNNAEQGV